MKKTIWTFGLISGAILSAMMLITVPFMDRIGFDRGEIIGYSTMVLSFLLIYFGIRSYRDNVAGGAVSFGRALTVGALIALISSVCYVATWEIIYYKVAPDFAGKFTSYRIEKIRQSGASAEEIQKKTAEIQAFAVRYRNPLFNTAITFVEPLPVGLFIALVSAFALSRRRKGAGALATSTAT